MGTAEPGVNGSLKEEEVCWVTIPGSESRVLVSAAVTDVSTISTEDDSVISEVSVLDGSCRSSLFP
jgi:hypothetical protein